MTLMQEMCIMEWDFIINQNRIPNVSDIVYLSAGQTIDIRIKYLVGGNTKATLNGGSSKTYVSIHKLSE